MIQLNALVEVGNTVIVAEHEMRVAAGADWLIDMGPGAGDLGGRVVACGPPTAVAAANAGCTAPYLAEWLAAEGGPAERLPAASLG
jgi:excinuclease ABC subunit A